MTISTCGRPGLSPRNDVIGNAGVLVAPAAMAVTASPWPDILIGLVVAGIFAYSSVQVIRASRALGLTRLTSTGA